MKKYIYISLMALVAIVACSKEQENSSVNGPKKVHLTFTGSTDALKTTLDTEDWGIDWSTSDKITVFAAVETPTNNEFTTESVSADDRVATFSGKAETASTYYALSPAQLSATVANALTDTDCRITANLPTEQNATVGSYDPQANVSVARASNYEFLFKNVGALVGFSLNMVDDINDITDVKIEAAGGEVLSGTVVVDPVYGEISSKSGESYVKLTGSFVNGSTYYFVILPGTYSNGFSITIWKGDQFIRLNKSGVQEIERNDNLNLGTLSGSNWKTAFFEGEEVTIQGAGVASPDVAGQKLAYVASENYWNTSITGSDVTDYPYNYEIFTKLQAGENKTIYFAANGGEKFTLNAEGTAVGHLSKKTDAAYSAPEDGIYRIRMHLPSGTAEVKQISEVKFDIYGLGLDSNILDYQGNGVWSLSNFPIKVGEGGDSYKNRYDFLVKFSDNSKQYYGRHSGNTNHPVYGTTEAEYFKVQPALEPNDRGGDFWAACFKYDHRYESGNGLAKCTMTLSMNNENGHYTHTISSISLPDIDPSEAMYIGGSAEEGQQMNYISSDYYTTTMTGFGDRADIDDNAIADYDYEIFTRLNAEEPIYFYNSTNGKYFTLTSNGTAIEKVASSNAASYSYQVPEGNGGIWRIRANFASGKACVRRIDQVRLELNFDNSYFTTFDYEGYGVWKKEDTEILLHAGQYGRTAFVEYVAKLWFNRKGDGTEIDMWQIYGSTVDFDGGPNSETDYSYWNLQPYTGQDWNNVFWFPSWTYDGTTAKKATIRLYMNNTQNGHYTQRFTDIHD